MSHRYRFDRFELRVSERLLYIDGQPASVGARAIDLLVALVERHGCLVSKAELLDLVWPDLVVEENNLQVQISALRKVLGPRAIATSPGRGYRFTLPVLDEPVGAGRPAPGLGADGARVPSLVPAPAPWVLPSLTGRLLGRELDLLALKTLSTERLVTIVGPGGIGKTALALAVAHQWSEQLPDGVAWVDLAGVREADLVVTVLAQSLGFPSGARDPQTALVSELRSLRLLLVIDNAEHLQPAVAAVVRAILAGASGVHLLVTSQRPLQLNGERAFRLQPLSVPEIGTTQDQAMAHGAVALLVDQAHAVDRRFALNNGNLEAVIGLCRRLDGIPLAIKLAAARVPFMGAQGVLDRLDQRFRLLGSADEAKPARHRTLLSALEWSHDLLDAQEQAVYRRLAVFAGGFSLHLAGTVAGGEASDEWPVIEALGALVDRSLVDVDTGDPPRYRLLDTSQAHAALKLDAAGEQRTVERRHAQALTALMNEAYELYWSSSDQAWLEAYGREVDNVRVALGWAQVNEPALAVELVGASCVLFLLLGLAAECRARFDTLERQVELAAPATAARYWLERSRVWWGVSNRLMAAFSARAADAYRALRDDRGLFLSLRCLAGSGLLNPVQAQELLADMARLEQPCWSTRLRLQHLQAQAGVYQAAGQPAQARTVAETLLVRAEAAGLEAVVSAALTELAGACLALNDLEEALKYCRRIMARARHRRDNFVLHGLGIAASAWLMQGRLDEARGALVDFVAASRSRGWEWFALYARLLAWLAALERRHEAALCAWGYAQQWGLMAEDDAPGAKAMAHALAVVRQALEPVAVEGLLAHGAKMETEAVCALVLAPASA